jgi:hypothetical protein
MVARHRGTVIELLPVEPVAADGVMEHAVSLLGHVRDQIGAIGCHIGSLGRAGRHRRPLRCRDRARYCGAGEEQACDQTPRS